MHNITTSTPSAPQPVDRSEIALLLATAEQLLALQLEIVDGLQRSGLPTGRAEEVFQRIERATIELRGKNEPGYELPFEPDRPPR